MKINLHQSWCLLVTLQSFPLTLLPFWLAFPVMAYFAESIGICKNHMETFCAWYILHRILKIASLKKLTCCLFTWTCFKHLHSILLHSWLSSSCLVDCPGWRWSGCCEHSPIPVQPGGNSESLLRSLPTSVLCHVCGIFMWCIRELFIFMYNIMFKYATKPIFWRLMLKLYHLQIMSIFFLWTFVFIFVSESPRFLGQCMNREYFHAFLTLGYFKGFTLWDL